MAPEPRAEQIGVSVDRRANLGMRFKGFGVITCKKCDLNVSQIYAIAFATKIMRTCVVHSIEKGVVN